MTIYSAVKAFVATFPELDSARPLTTDYVGDGAEWYVIRPITTNPIVSTLITGKEKRVFPFLFQSLMLTMDELERLDNIQLFESFGAWLESQSRAGVLPTLDAGFTSDEIVAVDWGFLYDQVSLDQGIYQIRVNFFYWKDAPS